MMEGGGMVNGMGLISQTGLNNNILSSKSASAGSQKFQIRIDTITKP